MYIPIYHDLQHALASLMLVLLVAGEWGFCYQTMYTYMVPLHMSVERVEYTSHARYLGHDGLFMRY